MAKIKPITFDYSASLIPEHGISQSQLDELKPKLDAAREVVLKDDMQQYASGDIPEDKQPLDAAFFDMPERILDEYQSDRENSELGRILKTAARLRDMVDKVVVLGIGGSYMGARALMESCCHPYYNELPREERGGRPRIYFEGNNVDNDWSQSLLQFLEMDSKGDGPEGSWAIVVISKSGGTLETAAAFRQFKAALKEKVGDRLPEYIVPVTGESGKLASLSDAIGITDRYLVPDGVGGRFSILSAVGLLPAAIMGIDVVTLLEAAAAMNTHFRSAPVGENVVLDYVGVNHLLEVEQSVLTRVMSVWSKSLESVGLWYDQLLAESLGKNERGALPLTVVNSRDLHSRAQQHQEGARDKVMNNVIVDSWRQDALAIGQSENNEDQLNELADKTLPEVMSAAIRGTNLAYAEDKRPTTNINLPAVNEAAVGQLFQMLMLATVVEGRLIDINPYGQPGVEGYKKYMNKLLREA
ncbi:glucose-6-phosphate isomerase [Mariniblastus fucicola]|uniref:Glucose-6-phosphate isomerase n=1 Tax=Mariniblastus fucicola TaxID=980251 RepID=A0A5B9PS81_9BACT|nr:glucose-6-phosphate isomerase [Mariniblastus fucicola]QEG25083.1 Glucose-6-phosphate isomerase [Mariniblastus fucicola]